MLTVRFAERSDSETLYNMICELAVYENMLSDVVNSPEQIEKVVFSENAAKAFLADVDGDAVGFALFFETYSTFLGVKGIHLEDLYVREAYRGSGYGKALFKAVADYTEKNGYGRMEWCCLDWNKPSQSFYDFMGGRHLDSWWIYRLSGDALKDVKNK